MHWAHTEGEPYSIIILTETRLATDMEFSTARFNVVHSAAKHAGVMVLICKKLAVMDRVTWRAIIPGRLVQVRLHGARRYTDIVAVYQQA